MGNSNIFGNGYNPAGGVNKVVWWSELESVAFRKHTDIDAIKKRLNRIESHLGISNS